MFSIVTKLKKFKHMIGIKKYRSRSVYKELIFQNRKKLLKFKKQKWKNVLFFLKKLSKNKKKLLLQILRS